jgi:hypothetical protein
MTDKPGLLDDGLVGWMVKYAQKHFKRVASDSYQFDDLLQDGYVIYCDCKRRYVDEGDGRVKNQAHFMSLFKRCFSNHITDTAYKRSRSPEIPLHDTGQEDQLDEDLVGHEDEIASFMVLVRQAPIEIRKVVNLFTTAEGLRGLQAPTRIKLDGSRETTHSKLCRLVGMDPSKGDLPQAIRDYFGDPALP